MRAIGLGLLLFAGALGACSGEPLGGLRQDAGGTSPIDASTGSFVPDASTTPIYSDACWAGSLPAETQPILPLSTTVDSCAAGSGFPKWSYPQNPAGNSADDRRYIVGRWSTCNAGLPGLPAHTAIEFGANGRWRLLMGTGSVNLSDALIPVSGTGTSGYYYLLGTGQLNLNTENAVSGHAVFVAFAGMDVLQFTDGGGATPVYARMTPSPLNGADNPPPTTAEGCSMVGTWDVPPNDGPVAAPAAVFSFDAAGNFVAGSEGTNLCDGHTMYGTYALSPGMFQLTSNVGFGVCAWWYQASFQAVFDASCNQLSLTRSYDNCTGGRGYFNEPTTMTRRTAASADAGTTPPPGVAVP
jgi:hypothetical protein